MVCSDGGWIVGDAGTVLREVAVAAFDEIEGCIHGNSRDPGGERSVVTKAGKLVVGAQERLLRGLFRVGLIAGDAEGDTMDGAEVAIHENPVGVPVSGQYLLNRFCLGFVHSPD